MRVSIESHEFYKLINELENLRATLINVLNANAKDNLIRTANLFLNETVMPTTLSDALEKALADARKAELVTDAQKPAEHN